MGSEQGQRHCELKIKSGMCHSASLEVRLTRVERLCAQNAVTASNARVTFGRFILFLRFAYFCLVLFYFCVHVFEFVRSYVLATVF